MSSPATLQHDHVDRVNFSRVVARDDEQLFFLVAHHSTHLLTVHNSVKPHYNSAAYRAHIMFGVTPAYIGKPPPNWKRKQREWKERQARARELQEERDRELSPAVPDPEPVTPSRSEIFGSPNKSGRVYRTYAHKRARSRASSVADDSDDAQEGGEYHVHL